MGLLNMASTLLMVLMVAHVTVSIPIHEMSRRQTYIDLEQALLDLGWPTTGTDPFNGWDTGSTGGADPLIGWNNGGSDPFSELYSGSTGGSDPFSEWKTGGSDPFSAWNTGSTGGSDPFSSWNTGSSDPFSGWNTGNTGGFDFSFKRALNSLMGQQMKKRNIDNMRKMKALKEMKKKSLKKSAK